MKNVSRFAISSSLVLVGAAAADGAAQGYAGDYASIDFSYMGPDIVEQAIGGTLEQYTYVSGQATAGEVGASVPLSDGGFYSYGTDFSTANPVGRSFANVLTNPEYEYTNVGLVSEQLDGVMTASSYAIALNDTHTDYANPFGSAIIEAFHEQSYSFVYNGNTYIFYSYETDSAVYSQVSAYAYGVSDLREYYGSLATGQTYVYETHPGPGGAWGSVTVVGMFSWTLAPGETEYVYANTYAHAGAQSVPSPAAILPFALGLLGTARRRRSACGRELGG